MKTMTASEAKNKFGQLLGMERAAPARIQKRGRDVAAPEASQVDVTTVIYHQLEAGAFNKNVLGAWLRPRVCNSA